MKGFSICKYFMQTPVFSLDSLSSSEQGIGRVSGHNCRLSLINPAFMTLMNTYMKYLCYRHFEHLLLILYCIGMI